MNYLQYLADHVWEFTVQLNEKFYLSGELKAIKEEQYKIIVS